MQRIWTSDIGKHVGERVRLCGWMHRFRQLSNVSFLLLRDAKGLAQVVIDDPMVVSALSRLFNESVLSVEGKVVLEGEAKGGLELHEASVDVISSSFEPPPFDLYRPTLKAQLPTILDHAPLALRHQRKRAVFQISAVSMEGFRAALRAMDFVEIQTPKIVASATEGGANVFKIDYFDRPAYLAQSPQFYKQTMVGVFERVFEVGPVFRAEAHDTSRHINEYVSLDAEIGFIEDHTTVMRILNQVIQAMVHAIQDNASAAVATLGMKLPQVPDTIPAIHFTDAQDLIQHETGEDAHAEPDLAPHHERWLGDWARKQYASEFLFVLGYPMSKRPFYTHPDPLRPGYSRGFDLLFRGLELVTGGQRLHRYADYVSALEKRGLSLEPFASYLEAFKYGMPPHGGFAIGLERWLLRLIEGDNIKETTLFPRDMNRLSP